MRASSSCSLELALICASCLLAGVLALSCSDPAPRVSVTAEGELAWQKWPLGDHRLRGPWVDDQGSVYIVGNGHVASLAADGELRWKLQLGFNRAVGDLMWNAARQLLFDTSMAELHSDPATSGGYRFYWESEPNGLLVVTATGELASNTPYTTRPPADGWPGLLPVPEDGAHRVVLP